MLKKINGKLKKNTQIERTDHWGVSTESLLMIVNNQSPLVKCNNQRIKLDFNDNMRLENHLKFYISRLASKI